MSPGVKEVILLSIFIVMLFLLPRMLKSGSGFSTSRGVGFSAQNRKSIGYLRLALFVSVLWIAAAMLILKPWENQWVSFMALGVGPVALGWGIRWVIEGFR